jgi:hypothetical protein
MMKRLVAITIRVALAGLAGAAISLIPLKAADANIRLAEQSCEVKADEQNLSGAEKDNFIFKCQAGIGAPSVTPIATGRKDRIWAKNQVRAIAENYWFCDSLNDDDCVWIKVETSITPAVIKLIPPRLPLTTGGCCLQWRQQPFSRSIPDHCR